MKLFAKFIPVLTVLSTSVALAQGYQTSSGTSRTPVKEPGRLSGFSVNYMYMNATDVSITWSKKSSDELKMKDDKGTTHAGLNGINMGYKLLRPESLGFDAGANILVGMNPSETSANSRFYQIAANMNYSFNSSLHTYFGGNISYWEDPSSDTSGGTKIKVEPGVGAQVGLGFQKNNFQWTAGYNLMSYNYKFDFSNSSQTRKESATAQIGLGGFATQIGYIF